MPRTGREYYQTPPLINADGGDIDVKDTRELELKKGFKAEKKKQKGLESITKKEFKPKYKEYTKAKLEKEASQVPNRPIKKLEELPEPKALKTGKMSGQQAKSNEKMSGIAKNLGYFLNK